MDRVEKGSNAKLSRVPFVTATSRDKPETVSINPITKQVNCQIYVFSFDLGV